MSRKKISQSRVNQQDKRQDYEEKPQRSSRGFKLEFKNASQKLAYSAFDQHDVLFLLGAAGTGKSYLAMAFAISEILAKKRKRIIISRPVVEAGEKLGFLPGTLEEKLDPYMMPLFDQMNKLLGPKEGNIDREKIDRITEIAPIAYLRGRTFDDSICILDEAQNCTFMQMKLFLTRFGENSKVIITGDPQQSDLYSGQSALMDVVRRLSPQPGIGVVNFSNDCIVRHPLIGKIIERLEAE